MAQISTCKVADAMVIRQPQTVPDDGEYHCSFCGEKTGRGSFWNGPHQTVVLCTRCLGDGTIIGALIGDAVLDKHSPIVSEMIIDDVDKHLKQIALKANRSIIKHLSITITSLRGR